MSDASEVLVVTTPTVASMEIEQTYGGDADYQVTQQDFDRLKEAARGRKDGLFKRYAHLNHCFLWTDSERATPASYGVPGHVASAVIDDIAAWIKTRAVSEAKLAE